MDICIYPRYIYGYYTNSITMGTGLGRIIQYHLRTGGPLVKWLEISSRCCHPEQPTGHTATVSPKRKFLPNSKLTQVKLNLGSLLWGHINSKASGHSDRIYSIWLSFIISMINYGYAWLIKGFMHIFLSIIDLLFSNWVVLMTRGPVHKRLSVTCGML